jgi:hypothetical protein
MIKKWMDTPIQMTDETEEQVIVQKYSLLAQEFSFPKSEINGQTPFLLCCQYHPFDTDLIATFVQLDADWSITNSKGENALWILSKQGGTIPPNLAKQITTLELDYKSRNLLHLLCLNPKTKWKAVKVILSRLSKESMKEVINQKDVRGRTPFMNACR